MTRQMTRRGFLGLTGGTAVAGGLALAGCGGDSGGDATSLRMTWWGNDTRNANYLKALKVFEEKHAGTKITSQYSGYDGYFDKFNTEVAGGSAPDLVQMDVALVSEYAERGVLRELDPMLSSKQIDLSSFPQGLRDAATVGGKHYGVSSGTGAAPLTYDYTVLREIKVDPPDNDWTWEDMRAKALEVAKKLGRGKYGVADSGGDDENLHIFVRQRRRELFTAEGKLGFTEDDLAEWLTYWDELRRSGACVPGHVTAAAATDESARPILAGIAPMTLGTGLEVGLPSLTKHELRFVVCPNGPSGSAEGQYLSAGVFLSINARSQATDLATEIIDFFANDTDAIKIMGISRGIPPSDKAREILEPTLNPAQRRAVEFTAEVAQRVEAAKAPAPPARPKGAGEVKELLWRLNQEISFGKTTVDGAVKRFFRDASRALSS